MRDFRIEIQWLEFGTGGPGFYLTAGWLGRYDSCIGDLEQTDFLIFQEPITFDQLQLFSAVADGAANCGSSFIHAVAAMENDVANERKAALSALKSQRSKLDNQIKTLEA